MQRRDLIKLAALTGASLHLKPALGLFTLMPPPVPPNPSSVKHVSIVFKCHLDVGFTNTQAAVKRKYFDVYYPQAIRTAAAARTAGPDSYIWTTGSWMLYEYLEQATSQQRRDMEKSIAAGDIAWHALPFTWQTEMLDPSMITGALAFSSTLDTRFGRRTIAAKMSDVNGHSRGLISPLVAAGVKLLDIGVNGACTIPEVPAIFSWCDPASQSLTVVYHPGYGGDVQVPGTDLALSVEMRTDNGGPHSAGEIAAIYTRLRAKFPNAALQPSTLSDFAAAVGPYSDRLPTVTGEIGDTWIYGVPSDPPKVAQYRELARLRQQWLSEKKFTVGDATDRQFLERLLLAVEHTWGTDTKSYLDSDHYTVHDLQVALADPVKFPGYKIMADSWQEKRDDVTQSIVTLPPALHTEAQHHLQQLTPSSPDTTGLKPMLPRAEVVTPHFILSIDPSNGSIVRLQSRKTWKEWASAEHPLALFTYLTLSAEDYTRYRHAYTISTDKWVLADFGKPNIDRFGAVSREWCPTLVHAWSTPGKHQHSILLQLKFDDRTASANSCAGWPQSIFLELTLPNESPTLHLRLTTLDKPATRLPESMSLTFNPRPANPGSSQAANWSFEKVGQTVHPSDVVSGGNRNMHAISDKIRFSDSSGTFEIATLDAPVVSLADRSPLYFSETLPTLQQGIHFNLYNNAWGTNYVQWNSGDWCWRFTATFA